MWKLDLLSHDFVNNNGNMPKKDYKSMFATMPKEQTPHRCGKKTLLPTKFANKNCMRLLLLLKAFDKSDTSKKY